jgi:PiT family inorganic phosphate transporter
VALRHAVLVVARLIGGLVGAGLASASALLYTTAFAFAAPISTTQTITSSILGVGATRRLSAVRWIVARDIVLAWVLTIPMAALAAAATFAVLQLVFF